MTEIELKMNPELQSVVAFLKDELKDAIVADEMRQIISDYKEINYHMEEDRKYYKRLEKAARVVLRHYETP